MLHEGLVLAQRSLRRRVGVPPQAVVAPRRLGLPRQVEIRIDDRLVRHDCVGYI